MNIEEAKQLIGDKVRLLVSTKPYTADSVAVEIDEVFATLVGINEENGDCRIIGRTGNNYWINVRHIEAKYLYPKERRNELDFLRKAFEEKYVTEGGSLQHIHWEECCNGVGDYQVDWVNIDTNDPDFNEEIMIHAQNLNDSLYMYIAGSDSKKREIETLKCEIADFKIKDLQLSPELANAGIEELKEHMQSHYLVDELQDHIANTSDLTDEELEEKVNDTLCDMVVFVYQAIEQKRMQIQLESQKNLLFK